jgi:ABC-type phosphate transport system auxiliary subunit
MIEVATALIVIKGAKAAFDVAKEAFDEIRECAEAGKSAHESLGALTSFFSSAGKAEEGIAHAKELQENPPEGQEDSRSDYEIVIEMMVAERQLKKLRADRRQREVDHRLHLKALEMAARREKAKKVQFIQDMFAIALGGIVSILIIIGIVWMFTLGD